MISLERILVRDFQVLESDIAKAKTYTQRYGGRIEKVLVNMGSLPEDSLQELYATFFKVPMCFISDLDDWQPLGGFSVSELQFFVERKWVPHSKRDSGVVFATSQPFDLEVHQILENQNIIKNETNTIKKMKSKQNIIYNNNISINFFLDNYCSNAQPIQDFINNISFKLGDIMRNNELVENFISKKLLKGLEDLPVTERPIHCTDQKRKNFIVKDELEGWIKDSAIDNNSKLYTKVDQLHKKAYIDFYKQYDIENPLPHDGEQEHLKFNISSQIINQNEDTNKIIKNMY